MEKDIELYEKYLSKFFPVSTSEEKTESDKKEAEKPNDSNEIKSESSTEVNSDENRIKLENLKCENDAQEETLNKEAEKSVLLNTASNLKNEGDENDLQSIPKVKEETKAPDEVVVKEEIVAKEENTIVNEEASPKVNETQDESGKKENPST